MEGNKAVGKDYPFELGSTKEKNRNELKL